jgi:hypothetical protein
MEFTKPADMFKAIPIQNYHTSEKQLKNGVVDVPDSIQSSADVR